MNFIKMVKRNDPSGRRILVIALAISLAWHIFWLSAVQIVASPIPKSSVKFSKVAFLGPILARVSMELRASPASRSPLERRYRSAMGEAFCREAAGALHGASDLKYASRTALDRTDRKLLSVIDDAVAGRKLEPDYPVE